MRKRERERERERKKTPKIAAAPTNAVSKWSGNVARGEMSKRGTIVPVAMTASSSLRALHFWECKRLP